MSSVKEALEMLVVKDQLEGAAWQQYTLEKLPVVLILHLKLFDYNMGGCTKILKTVSFPIELKIDTSEWNSEYELDQRDQPTLITMGVTAPGHPWAQCGR